MKKTVGSVDRIVRGVVAVVALVIAGVVGFTSTWGIILVVVAAIMAVTGSSAMCPIYSALGVSTMAKGENDSTGHSKVHVH